MSDFVLDPRLANDTVKLWDWPLCSVLLMNDARYPWVILVPRVPEVAELFELSADDQSQLLKESMAVGAFMAKEFGADKINIANLGNVVRQLHIHHVARFKSDATFPGPVWGVGTAEPYGNKLEEMIERFHKLEKKL